MTLNLVLVAKLQEFLGPICCNQQTEGEISLHFKCNMVVFGLWWFFVCWVIFVCLLFM